MRIEINKEIHKMHPPIIFKIVHQLDFIIPKTDLKPNPFDPFMAIEKTRTEQQEWGDAFVRKYGFYIPPKQHRLLDLDSTQYPSELSVRLGLAKQYRH